MKTTSHELDLFIRLIYNLISNQCNLTFLKLSDKAIEIVLKELNINIHYYFMASNSAYSKNELVDL